MSGKHENASHVFYKKGYMFELQGKLKFVNIDTDRLLVYEMVNKYELSSKDIWVKVDDTQRVKHILAAINIKKMIPVIDEVISIVNINYAECDNSEVKRYKDLLNKEYSLCLKIIQDIMIKASHVYEKQTKTRKVQPFACDFRALEKVADEFKNKL